MPGLLDIAVSEAFVTVGTTKVDVPGISAAGIAALMGRFPEIRMLMSGKELNLKPDAIMTLAPQAIAAIIAAGVGSAGDEAYEARAATLGVGLQLEFIETIINVTMPGGVAPFVARLTALMGGLETGLSAVSGENRTSTADMKSPKA